MKKTKRKRREERGKRNREKTERKVGQKGRDPNALPSLASGKRIEKQQINSGDLLGSQIMVALQWKMMTTHK